MSRYRLAIVGINAAVAGLSAYFSLDKLLDYANTRAALFQEHLSRAPEITEQVYEAARQSAEKLSGVNYLIGLVQAGLAASLAGIAIYAACSKDD
jgi:hypothetical protein